jgi:hypothetical protein
MRQRRHQDQISTWTPRDEVLLYTCRLAAALVAGGDMGHVAEVLAPFPPSLADDERFFAAGPFTLADFIPLGDGSWQSNGFVVAGTGALGMGMLAASLAGNAAAKSRAQAAAAANAVPRWVPIAHGTVYISQYGFHMHTPQVWTWSWRAIAAATMAAPAAVQISGEGAKGPISWLLSSDWAELIFVCWALARHPRHPQLLSGGWLPPGWANHATAHHPDVAPQVPGLGAPL